MRRPKEATKGEPSAPLLASLGAFSPATVAWFDATFPGLTRTQSLGFPVIAEGESALIAAPTGTGKTLTAFLTAIDRLMTEPVPSPRERLRVLYISPLRALAVDVEKNLRAPLAGIAKTAAAMGIATHLPTAFVRSGDTPARDRTRMTRTPPDILITTPESLYLLLTTKSRDLLATIDTVILDEIHQLVATKRGAHLFLSLERLEALRPKGARPLQRVGLSATQKPLDEVARCLGGAFVHAESPDAPARRRPVHVIDATGGKAWDLRVEAPIPLGAAVPVDREAAREGAWPTLVARLVELVREHTSTMIFANSRRLAERLATMLNDAAGEEIARAHHGSIAREERLAIEERLKQGDLPAIVATSSLELGLDLGAVDLVVQVESPPSVSAGIQRVGRAGHQVGAVSRGIVLPKHRGDLLAAAATTDRMRRGEVEPTIAMRSPLDVLAQQIVAIVAMEAISEDALFALCRRSAPFFDLGRSAFEGVLDMLSGHYPSDAFSGLRPRVTWDRDKRMLRPREGAQRVAIVSGGTIADRGLFGVFLLGDHDGKSRRVGELDEEMVHESRVGDVFQLGASTWRIAEIGNERVLVTHAPGELGRMPFWRGDRPSRPLELGRAVGALTRAIATTKDKPMLATLTKEHGLDARAAEGLVRYVRAQQQATKDAPTDTTLVVERGLDELGAPRILILSPFGARVHAPWCMVLVARLERELGQSIESLVTDDGIALRLPEAGAAIPDAQLFPAPEDIEPALIDLLSSTPLFAARFRENAARALLLPRRAPGRRQPLWLQRKRSRDLLAIAGRFPAFPIVLETYREVLRDVFDLQGLTTLLRDVRDKRVAIASAETRAPSPFAASLLFAFTGAFLYDPDAPAIERNARTLGVDAAELKELLGEVDLRDVLEPEVLAEVEARAARRLDKPLASADGAHDLLLFLGDLSREDLLTRGATDAMLDELKRDARAFSLKLPTGDRLVAAEDVARYALALDLALPSTLPHALATRTTNRDEAREGLIARFARGRGPFLAADVKAQYGFDATNELARLEARGALVRGRFRRDLPPSELPNELCDADVLRSLRARSLKRLRGSIAPATHEAFARFCLSWHGVDAPRAGDDGRLAATAQLQGAPLVASTIDTAIFPARVASHSAASLDALTAAGEIVWVGLEPLGDRDGKIALYLPDDLARLAPRPRPVESPLAVRVRELLAQRGAVFFSDIASATGAFPPDVLAAIWELVWAGHVTNDTLAPLRSRLEGSDPDRRARPGSMLRSRRVAPPGGEGRWSLLAYGEASAAERKMALTQSLLDRHGVLTREAVLAEGIEGGFNAIYDVLSALEDAGRVRRGYFVEGLGAAQFARPGADEKLRAARDPGRMRAPIVLAATDPANPFGASLPWPDRPGARLGRAAGASVIVRDGQLAAFVGRAERSLVTLPPSDAAARAEWLVAVLEALQKIAEASPKKVMLITSIDGGPADASDFAKDLLAAGVSVTSKGALVRAAARAPAMQRRR